MLALREGNTKGKTVALTPSEHALVAEILMRGPISRRELASRLDLSAPSLTRLSKPFLQSGAFIEIHSPDDGAGPHLGRPRKGYDINPDYGRYVGINLTHDRAHAVLTDLRGQILESADASIENHEPEAVVEVLSALVAQLCPRPAARLFAVGISLGGQVQSRSVVTRNPFLGWKGIPLAQMLQERVDTLVAVENDVTALAEGAHLFGAARAEPNFAVVTIGVGVGYGLVINDRVVSSSDTGLGLAGHIPLASGGPYCSQGHRGCSEALLTFSGISNQLAEWGSPRLTFAEFLESAATGDKVAEDVLFSAASALGRLLAMVANLTMFPRILLSGEGTGLWTAAEPKILEELNRYRDPDAAPVEIVLDSGGKDSWAAGAAATAIVDSLEKLPLEPLP